MPRIKAVGLTREKHQEFLDWLSEEGIDPAEVVDNGLFSVHNGQISGFKFILTPDGKVKMNRRGYPILVHFRQKQKHPLPGMLEV